MNLTYEEYVEITIALGDKKEKAEEYIRAFPEDSDFWRNQLEIINSILKKIEKPRERAYIKAYRDDGRKEQL